MMVMMMPTTLPRSIGSAFRDKSLLHNRYRAAQTPHHVSKNRIRLNPHGFGREHCSHVAIGQVIHNTHQLKRIIRLNTKELFNSSLNDHALALIAAQDITMLHVLSARQDHSHSAAIRQHCGQAPALAIF
jgi:hypothetical protein